MSDELNEVRPGDRITSDLINTLIRRVNNPATGEGDVTVPPLFGRLLTDARDTLLGAKLAVGKVLDTYGREVDAALPSIPVPVVIGQIPPPGVRVDFNHAVVIAVSGQAPGATLPSGQAIPDLMHKTLAEAQQALSQRGIQSSQIQVLDVFGRPVVGTDPHKTDRFIISQLPLPGTAVSQTSVVRLVTTEVAGSIIPDLTREKLIDAKARLVTANLAFVAFDVTGTLVDANDNLNSDRIVINQVPPPGPQVKTVSSVKLVTTIKAPPTGTAMPDLIHQSLATSKTVLEAVGISVNDVTVRDVFGGLVDLGVSQEGDRLVLNQLPPAGSLVNSDRSVHLVATAYASSTPPPPPTPGGGTPAPAPVAPKIIAIYPLSPRADSEIQIVGANFDPNHLANRVTFGDTTNVFQGLPSPESTTSTLFVVVPRELVPYIYNAIPKNVTVTVETFAGKVSTSHTFYPAPSSSYLPQISHIEPPVGVIGTHFRVIYNSGKTSTDYAFFDGLPPDRVNSQNLIPTGITGIDPGASKSIIVHMSTGYRLSPAFAYTVMRPLTPPQTLSEHPAFEEKTVIEEPPASEEKTATKESPASEEKTATEESPTPEERTVIEEPLASDEKTAIEEPPAPKEQAVPPGADKPE